MYKAIVRSSSTFPPSRFFTISQRFASSQSQSQKQDQNQQSISVDQKSAAATKTQGKKKTMAELDAELQRKMSGISGDGGEAGIEYEDGKPVAMKRGVRDNMFRYI
ncbi:hypothetical protein F5Y11DRAFT_353619 [Daldinia sp. FL1419]|nr:hypothetical protein F5Y11DRAFT_353619 [Daldinia sp. FL1419]